MFQFLIGSLVTDLMLDLELNDEMKFQFLIGSLVT